MCKELHRATNLAIDPDLLDRAVEVSGERTKKAVVTKAPQEFIARREQKKVSMFIFMPLSQVHAYGRRIWRLGMRFALIPISAPTINR